MFSITAIAIGGSLGVRLHHGSPPGSTGLDAGPMIDDVRRVAVPEPASYAWVAGVLTAAYASIRRRRSNPGRSLGKMRQHGQSRTCHTERSSQEKVTRECEPLPDPIPLKIRFPWRQQKSDETGWRSNQQRKDNDSE